ncbi:hypothetical protein WA158_005990 [Blastocystis sp. Blastoise]
MDYPCHCTIKNGEYANQDGIIKYSPVENKYQVQLSTNKLVWIDCNDIQIVPHKSKIINTDFEAPEPVLKSSSTKHEVSCSTFDVHKICENKCNIKTRQMKRVDNEDISIDGLSQLGKNTNNEFMELSVANTVYSNLWVSSMEYEDGHSISQMINDHKYKKFKQKEEESLIIEDLTNKGLYYSTAFTSLPSNYQKQLVLEKNHHFFPIEINQKEVDSPVDASIEEWCLNHPESWEQLQKYTTYLQLQNSQVKIPLDFPLSTFISRNSNVVPKETTEVTQSTISKTLQNIPLFLKVDNDDINENKDNEVSANISSDSCLNNNIDDSGQSLNELLLTLTKEQKLTLPYGFARLVGLHFCYYIKKDIIILGKLKDIFRDRVNKYKYTQYYHNNMFLDVDLGRESSSLVEHKSVVIFYDNGWKIQRIQKQFIVVKVNDTLLTDTKQILPLTPCSLLTIGNIKLFFLQSVPTRSIKETEEFEEINPDTPESSL